MATRAQLLQEFNNFTDDELAKLINIGNSILNPNLNQLTAADFASMISLVFDPGGLADQFYPTWTDRSPSDFGRFLVELYCLISDKDFFYINHYHKEAFGTTAEIYRSLVHKSTSNGFKPPSNVPSTMNVPVVFNPSAGETVVKGTIVIGLAGTDLFNFCNDTFTIPASGVSQTISVPFLNCTVKTLSGNFNGRNIVITDNSVCDSSVLLNLNGDTSWVEVTTFANGNPGSKIFMVFYNELGQAQLIFPNPLFGVFPVLNTPYTLTYAVGGGSAGNIAANLLNRIVQDDSVTGVISFTQPNAAISGTDLLALEVLRQRYIGFQRTLNRAVTNEDVATIAMELAWVKNAKSINISNLSFLFIAPVGSQTLTPLQITEASDYFLVPTSKLGMGRSLLISDPNYVAVEITAVVYILNGFSNSGATVVANSTAQDYLNPQNFGQFGAGVNRSYLASLIIQNVDGAQNVDFTVCRVLGSGNPVGDVLVQNTQLIDWTNSVINITVVGGQ
jgi:hypothetical protein